MTATPSTARGVAAPPRRAAPAAPARLTRLFSPLFSLVPTSQINRLVRDYASAEYAGTALHEVPVRKGSARTAGLFTDSQWGSERGRL